MYVTKTVTRQSVDGIRVQPHHKVNVRAVGLNLRRKWWINHRVTRRLQQEPGTRVVPGAFVKWFLEEDEEGRRAVLDIDIDIDPRYGEDASPDCVIIRFPSKRFKVWQPPYESPNEVCIVRISDPAPDESDPEPDDDGVEFGLASASWRRANPTRI